MPYKIMAPYFLRLVILLLFLPFGLEANSETKSLYHLNKIRENAGLIKLKYNESLAKAASSHAQYLIVNQVYGHYEKRDQYAFTGISPADRVIEAGYPSTFVMENLSVNPQSEEKSIDNLFSAIYHRFVFLDFDKDEIGIGSYISQKMRRKQSAYVYNLGSSSISKLCTHNFIMESGKYFIKDICKDKEKMIPRSIFRTTQNSIRRHNANIVLYPYEGQKEIWPAFYREAPDPLPYYDVSGFPISVQFNPLYFKNIKLISFRLFDEKGNALNKTKILQHSNDHNQLFTTHQFALMPLKRLDFSTTYTAEFHAVADGKTIKKRWSFRTVKPKKKLFAITKDHTQIRLKAGEEVIIYIVPTSKRTLYAPTKQAVIYK